jgi:transcription antitermination factor NusG
LAEILSIKKDSVVSIIDGPFSGHFAKVLSLTDNKVNLLFEILGSDTTISLSLGAVSNVETN